jgi:hypothetical protein
MKRLNTGIPYEVLVQGIFQELHDQTSVETIRVKHNVRLKGRSTRYQIDVYWEFSKAGIRYKTIVQARDWTQRIKQEDVLAFAKILDDIPGQPRGVMVTRTGFQRGARAVAKKHGIKLYRLHEAQRKPTTITDVGWAAYRYDPAKHMVDVTTFRPDFSLNLSFAQPTLPPEDIKRYPPRDLVLSNENGRALGTVRDVIAEFVEEIKKSGTRSGTFARQFDQPTFLSYPTHSEPSFRLSALNSDINIVEQPGASFPLLPPDFVEFILEDLDTGKQRAYRRRVTK